MNWITFPTTLFVQVLRRLAADSRLPLLLRCGVHVTTDGEEWLVREALAAGAQVAVQPYERLALIQVTTTWPTGVGTVWPVQGWVWLGIGALEGYLGGGIRRHGEWQPLEGVRLSGRGMHRLSATRPGGGAESAQDAALTGAQRVRWSRTIGALGGVDVWQRLTQLRVGVVGCGRSGSLVAEALARLGVRDVTLIDPDRVELHNLGEMALVTSADVGEAKSVALARRLCQLLPADAPPPAAVTVGIMEPAALALASECEVLFCCVDSDGARLATGMLATLFNRVLVDIGTGIQFDAGSAAAQSPADNIGRGSQRTLGADVRLIVPGEGCLQCMGGVANYQQAVEELFNRSGGARDHAWQTERAGSLQWLNLLAVAVGMQMMQDLVAQRIGASTWAQLRVDAAGILTTAYRHYTPEATGRVCPVCAQRGLGDYGL